MRKQWLKHNRSYGLRFQTENLIEVVEFSSQLHNSKSPSCLFFILNHDTFSKSALRSMMFSVLLCLFLNPTLQETFRSCGLRLHWTDWCSFKMCFSEVHVDCIMLYQSPCHFILCSHYVFPLFTPPPLLPIGLHIHVFGCPPSSSCCTFSPFANLPAVMLHGIQLSSFCNQRLALAK